MKYLYKKSFSGKEQLVSFDQKMLNPEKTVYLLDGSSLLYRSYYGLKPLTTSSGVQVQAVYNFCRTIKKMVEQYNIKHLGIVWDSKGATFRHEIYPAYKATRQAPPSDLFVQKDYILKFADLIGIKQIAITGIEADDLLYSVAQEQVTLGMKVVIITLDKDMRQMLSDDIIIYDPLKDSFITAESAEKSNGIPIAKLPFYFALIGDSSDNIPGVRGIGPKGALDLVLQFDSLDDLYTNINRIDKARIKTLLLEQKENAYLSLTLFLLQKYPCHTKANDFLFSLNTWSDAKPLFEELEFKTFLKELGSKKESLLLSKDSLFDYWKQKNFKTVTTLSDLQDLCAALKKAKVFACDTETTSGKPLESTCVGISFATDDESVWYVPFAHTTAEAQLSREQVVEHLFSVFTDPSCSVVMHHAKFDLLVLSRLQNWNIQLGFDTLIAARLLTPDWQKIGLKQLSSDFLGEEMLGFDDVATKEHANNFSNVPLQPATWYSGADARQTIKLYHLFKKQLHDAKLEELYITQELPLVSILAEMEKEGIYIDQELLARIGLTVAEEIEKTEYDICALASILPGSINLNAPRQIEHLLFNVLGLPPQKKLAKGEGYSTDAEVLTKLASLHPVAQKLITYRELSKLKNTYIDALPTYINPYTGLIHTSFSQTGVATGRLSSSEPNLQNIPASGFGIEIRAAFKPKDDHCFIAADYSQIELRVLAHLAQEKSLIDAFIQGKDIHTQTAAHLFDINPEQVSHEQRQLGKRINFSVLYGLTPYGLSRDLSIPLVQAKQYIEKYHAQYPRIFEWMEEVVLFAKEHGYVQTEWKRRRYVPNIYEKNRTLYEEARRIAINTVAQGTAADITKRGMIKVCNTFKKEDIDGHILLQIHDELLVSVAQSQAQKANTLIIQDLQSVAEWSVPLVVTTRIGSNWKEVSK